MSWGPAATWTPGLKGEGLPRPHLSAGLSSQQWSQEGLFPLGPRVQGSGRRISSIGWGVGRWSLSFPAWKMGTRSQPSPDPGSIVSGAPQVLNKGVLLLLFLLLAARSAGQRQDSIQEHLFSACHVLSPGKERPASSVLTLQKEAHSQVRGQARCRG